MGSSNRTICFGCGIDLGLYCECSAELWWRLLSQDVFFSTAL